MRARGHARACMFTLCRISRMRTGLYRKGVYTRAATYSSALSLPLSHGISAADRLAPQGPCTNNCRPVNSRYDTLEEVGERASERARYTYSSGGGNWRSSRLPRYKNEIRRVAPVAPLLEVASPRLAPPSPPCREQKTLTGV